MSRKRTGLRNRNRTGIHTYAKKGKGANAERYDRPMLDHPNHPYAYRYACCVKTRVENA